MLAADIRDLYLDTATNLLWTLGSEGGLNAINYITCNVEKTVIRKTANSNDWAISFELSNDRFWICTGIGLTIYNLKEERFETSPLENILKNKSAAEAQIRLCKKDKFNNIWACINGLGIAIINSSTQEIIKVIPIADLNDILKTGIIEFYSACEIAGQLLFGTSQGLRLIKYSDNYQIDLNNTPCLSLPSLNSKVINWICFGPDRRIYVAADNLFSFDILLKDPIKYMSPLGSALNWFTSVSSGYFYNNNILFLGCKGGLGLMQLSEDPFKPITNSPAFLQKLDHIYGIWPYSEDSIIVIAASGIHLVRNNKQIEHIKENDLYQAGMGVPNVSFIENNSIIISSPKGLATLKSSGLVPLSDIFSEFKEFQSWQINSCAKMNDSIFALGTENFSGILLWNRRTRSITRVNEKSSPLRLAADVVNTVYKDSGNNLWVLSDKAITVIDKDLKTSTKLEFKDSATGLPVGIFFDMCEARGSYWIAAYSTGIIQLDSVFRIKRLFTGKDKLYNSGVYKIFNVQNKKLIITTNQGLSVFDLGNYTFNNYFQADGLHSNEFEEACGVYTGNKIYAGGINGFTIIDPAKMLKNILAPRLYFGNIEIETPTHKVDSTNIGIDRMKIPSNFSHIRIYFTGLNFTNPFRTTYKYKINELHVNWIDNNTQNFITLIGLSPGSYHLQVQAFNEDGLPSEIRRLTLVFLPKWYQTWWFKYLVLIAIGFGFYGLYKLRVSRLKKEEKIRNQVASDLHDELGSTLNSVKVYTNLAMLEKENKSHLEKVKEASQSAIASVKDIIWVLDDKRDTLEHLLNRLDQFARPLCDAASITYRQSIDNEILSFKLGKEEKRNLYMIIKESINNSIKYSNCKTIELQIKSNGTKLNIHIADDGKGFDINETIAGYGLNNILQRANEIRYHASIISSPGNGSLIQLEKK